MENVKKFYDALAADEAMRERANALNEKQETESAVSIIAFAKSEGYDFTAEELTAFTNTSKELSDNELEAVAGGAKDTEYCVCVVGGGGTLNSITCACVAVGSGKKKPGPDLLCIGVGQAANWWYGDA